MKKHSAAGEQKAKIKNRTQKSDSFLRPVFLAGFIALFCGIYCNILIFAILLLLF